MTTKGSYFKNATYLVLCCVKSLPWLFNRNLLTDIKISFYRNIVCRNVSCELGLNMLCKQCAKRLWPLITVRAILERHTQACRVFTGSSLILMFEPLFFYFFSKFPPVRNHVKQLNMQKIMVSIFLTMKATIFDTHGISHCPIVCVR